MSTNWTPHAYQEKAIKFMVQRGCAGLFLQPGLGKTSISLAAFKILKKKGMVRGALVVAPLRPVHLVWPKEIEKWTEFKGLKYQILHGEDKDDALDEQADIYLINPEGLDWLESRLIAWKGDWPFDVLIVDEVTKFKNTNTKRFKTLKPMLKYFRRRYILTGTPAPNGLMDLFGQMYVMDLGASFGPYITHFRTSYFYQSGFGGYEWSLRPGADDLIYKKIAPRVLQMSAEDYLQMPELIINDVYIDLPPEARKHYNKMEKTFLVDFGNGKITASNAAGASNKCRQIAAGGIYTGIGQAWEHIHSTKAEAVAELLEEMQGQPTLVAYEFLHDLDRLKKELGKNTPYIGGGVTTAQSKIIESKWNAGDLPVLLGQPQSVAHGLNLQDSGGNTIIWHTLTWNYEDYEQFIARVWRQGQKNGRVVVHRIIARDTLDEAVRDALERKAKGQGALFDAIKEYWKRKK